MADSSLDEFGKLLMERVRDKSIEQWDRIIDGTMKGTTSKKVATLLANASEQERQHLLALIPAIVDTTLHHLLWTVEQVKEMHLGHGASRDLRETSDGLTGDLVEWKDRFSQKRQF